MSEVKNGAIFNPTHTTGALAELPDYQYIVDLSRKHTHELGFLPFQAVQVRVQSNSVLIARCNGQHAGFLLHGVIRERVRIFQHCIQIDARHMLHGLRLLSGLVVLAGLAKTELISLHCRDGLASNKFWASAGFHLGGIVPGGHSLGRMLLEWHLNVPAAILDSRFPHGYAFAATCIALRARSQRDGRIFRQENFPQIFNRSYHNYAVQIAVDAASTATATATPDNLEGLLCSQEAVTELAQVEDRSGAIFRGVTADIDRVRAVGKSVGGSPSSCGTATHADYNIAIETPGSRKRGNPIIIGYGTTGDSCSTSASSSRTSSSDAGSG